MAFSISDFWGLAILFFLGKTRLQRGTVEGGICIRMGESPSLEQRQPRWEDEGYFPTNSIYPGGDLAILRQNFVRYSCEFNFLFEVNSKMSLTISGCWYSIGCKRQMAARVFIKGRF